MNESTPEPATGRRERKKARTRTAIQHHALRLFSRQGYEATTVTQIAEAADVSESTLFRYFPTKEDLVLWDDVGPHLAAAYRAQPARLGPIPALRATFTQLLGAAGTQARAQVRDRVGLMLSAPPLRAALLDQLDGPTRMLAGLVAERAGREPGDPAVRATAGAVVGVGLAAMFAAARDPGADVVDLLDEAMAHLEAGLPL
ncbi:MAG TPA: TetR family transcriptional regulator [Pseudonocardia sp.]|nr:TetR family transcriptional regulator [Pseudonocardia sp.]